MKVKILQRISNGVNKIKIGLIVLGLITAAGFAAGLVSQVEMKSELKNGSMNSEISEAGELGLSNPSAVYCKELGYGYEIKNTKEGQIGVCNFPDSSFANAWEFYSGESGGEHGYCAAKGYESKIEKNCAWSSKCNVCVLPDGKNVPAFVLMLKEKPKKDYLKNFYRDMEEGRIQKSPLENSSGFGELSQISSDGLPTSFDWRNNEGDWLTAVKNQGDCGSCWAFASVGAHESQINIQSSNPATDEDLSEQYLVSDCFPPANCDGLFFSDIPALFDFHRDNGIVEEEYFPYTATNSSCEPSGDYQHLKIESWRAVAANIVDIKTALVNEGPLWAGLYMSSEFDANNIMRCNYFGDRSINHAVVVVGYNDEGGYWIVRNSWGADWGPERNGYFKVGYGECNIDSYVGGYQDIIALKGEPVGPVCSSSSNCDDGNECTTDECINPGKTDAYCQNTPAIDGASCGGGMCCSGECAAAVCSTNKSCNDNNACTIDTCSQGGTCSAFCGHENITTCSGGDGCCPAGCTYHDDSDCQQPVLCWSGSNLYLYKSSTQASKFCKCAAGIYGYNSYKLSTGKKTAWKYNNTGDNTNWAVKSVSARDPISSVTCTNGGTYSTAQDYSFPKQ